MDTSHYFLFVLRKSRRPRWKPPFGLFRRAFRKIAGGRKPGRFRGVRWQAGYQHPGAGKQRANGLPRQRRQLFVGLGDDGQGALVRVEHRVQPLRFAERITRQRGG